MRKGEGRSTDLTARARALYEGSAVPVREIARLAGVSERTLYKYVAKHGWRKRYANLPRGEAAAAANRGRRVMPAPGFAPAKGAGGRFIRREDAGVPFAAGLKALDPAAQARAAAACDEAERCASVAEAEAELEYWERQKRCAWDAALGALQKIVDLRQERKTNPDRLRPEDFAAIERAMGLSAAAAADALEAVQAEHRRAHERLRGLGKAAVPTA